MGQRLKPAAIVFGGVGALLLAGFTLFTATVFTYDPQAPAAGDAVVVLTGGELRVREGLRLFANGAGRRLLISGVNQATSRTQLWRRSGVVPLLFDCCVDVDQRAHDTSTNATETRAWAEPWGFQRLVIVTSNYHMPRALMVLSRALPGVELVPHAVVSPHYRLGEWWRHPAAVKLVVVEYLKSIPAAARLLLSPTIRLGLDAALRLTPGPEMSSAPRRLSGL